MDSSEHSFKGDKMQSIWERNFPQDVVNEILIGLPVKSILRLKCVCKNWHAIIKSPGFVSKHFHHENNRTRLLLYYTSSNDREGVSLLPYGTLVGIPSSNDAIDYIQSPQIIEHLIGPIDGLFFLHRGGFESGDPMTLWNPSTRKFRPLPVPPIISSYFYASHTFGFGLDPLTGNYKVIWIRFLMDNRTETPLPYFVVAVYTLGSDTWRFLDPLTRICDLHNSLSATCINGAYYWLDSYHHGKHSILSFDMSLEVFRDIAGPDHPDETWGSLTLCNGSVALFLCQYGVYYQSIIVLCVMKDEGCWDKLVTVEPFVEVSRPLGFWNNEEVLLESRSSELFMYIRDTREIRNLGIFGDSKAVFSYKESLLSVKGQKKVPKGCDFFDTLGEDLTFSVPVAGDKALVDKTEELCKLVECFSREQEFYDRQDRFCDEYANVGGLPEDDLAKGWQMIIDDPARLQTFFALDGAKRNLYVDELVRGGEI